MKIHIILTKYGLVWVMVTRFGYGLWDLGGLWDFTGNRVGGHLKPMGYYRLWGVRSMV